MGGVGLVPNVAGSEGRSVGMKVWVGSVKPEGKACVVLAEGPTSPRKVGVMEEPRRVGRLGTGVQVRVGVSVQRVGHHCRAMLQVCL